jgi:hypothetical protein
MRPYVICKGDHLAMLAYQFGFDANTVWGDPANASLRQLRPDPDILFAGDVLYIPDPPPGPPPSQGLTPGSTNTFVSSPPTVTVAIKLTSPALASQPFTIPEVPALTGLTVGADGTVTLQIPVTVATFTLTFTSPAATFTCNLGNKDPITTLSGVFQRLQNLGFIDGDASFDPANLELIRRGLRALKATQPADSPPSGSVLGLRSAQTGRVDEARDQLSRRAGHRRHRLRLHQ